CQISSFADTHSRPTQTTDDHCTTIFASGLNHGVSSDNLNDYRRNVFANLCYLLELACAFEQAGSVPFQMENFYLPRAWTSRDFNLEAFLYSCEQYWRYEPPTVEPPSITVYSEESSHSVDLAKIASDPELGKYWAQRFRLFSRFNEGIQLDRDGFFSATPEAIAYHQAMRVKQSYAAKGIPAESLTVIDACSGCGANSIQFALVGFQVVAVEIDSKRIEMAVHNAEIYGVAEKIKFVCADFFDWARQELHHWNVAGLHYSPREPLSSPYAALFMSPPWGGPAYLDSDVFDLNWIQFGPRNERAGCTFWFSVQLASQLTEGNLLLFLPRNSNMAQLPQLAKCLTSKVLWSNEGLCRLSVEIEANVLNAKVKAISLYTGCLCMRK
ncbi:Trimethylguanosine synthase, partial [Fasciolopsis buskii]